MKSYTLHLVSACLLLLLPIAFSHSSPPPAGYQVIKKIPVGGEGSWDYLTMDSAARRLYVSHSTKVVVIDVDKGEVVGEIADTKGVHGIAVVPELNRGFTSNGQDNSSTIFDLKTLKVIGTVKTGRNPDCIIYDPASKRVFAFNRSAAADASATAIDAATGEVAGTILLGGRPEFAVADGKGQIFVNIDDKSEIAVIDSKKLTITQHWSLAPGTGPSGLAMDLKTRRLFSVCGNQKMMVMNADNGKIVAEVPIGRGTDAAAFDPGTNLAFSSNGGDGTVTVVHEDSADKFTVVENAKSQARARTMSLDTKTHNIYLATAEYSTPAAPAAGQPTPRAAMVPNSFTVLVMGKQ